MKIQVYTCIHRNPLDSSKKVREKSRECHNHKPQPFPDPKRKKSENLLQIAANMNIIENRQNAKSTQFVIKFGNFVSDI